MTYKWECPRCGFNQSRRENQLCLKCQQEIAQIRKKDHE